MKNEMKNVLIKWSLILVLLTIKTLLENGN
jgi:hypothetical protein